MDSLDQQLDYARNLCQQGRFNEGKNIYLQLNLTHPNNFRVLANLGALELNEKNYDASLSYFRDAVKLNSLQPVIHYNMGRALYELKMYEEAIDHYQIAITLHPNFVEAHLNYGLTLNAQENYTLAIDQYNKAIELKSDCAEAYSNRGSTLSILGKYEGALSDYLIAAKLNPDNAENYNNLGITLYQLARYDEAITSFDKAIQLNPNHAKAYSNRGLVFSNLGQHEISLSAYQRANQLNPNNPETYNNLGVAHYHLRQYKEAISSYDKAIQLNPNYAEAYSNRGLCFNDIREYNNALADYEKAIQLKPDYVLAYNNLGLTFYRLAQYEKALSSFNQAIQLEPDQALAYWNKSLIKLLMGDFEEGWDLYEQRWKKPGFEERRHTNIPLWTGEQDLKDKKLLIWSEQGQGDIIQFSRYALLAKSKGALVTFEAPRSLLSLLKTLDQDINLVEEHELLTSNFDFQIPVMSLPYAFKTTPETVPSNTSYIHADAKKIEIWSKKLGSKNKLRVGLVWSGSSAHSNDLNRSVPLEVISPLMELPYEFHSLQIHYKENDLEILDNSASKIIRHESELKDFSDTAALIENMDLIITVDTSVAHLASALGKPTWIMLPYSPDFRWLLDTNDSPWYPTAKLFRQSQIGDWNLAIGQIIKELENLDQ